jgi:hypothetical protein
VELPLPTAPPAAGQLAPGQLLAGYEILEEINRGGMGAIFKAKQLGLNRLVALKVILPDRMGSEDAVRRFKREAQAAALFSHPNIVTVYATDLDGPVPYLAMEYVNGIDLHRLVKQGGPLSVADACSYILQAAEGLQHAHEHGLVHRDIKPANLMVTPNPLTAEPGQRPRVKILDLGLARVTGCDIRTSGDLTRAGEFLGTPDYISPEQAEDSRAADTRSDLYSLGGAFHFLLVGHAPFPEKTLIAKLKRMLTQPPPSVLPHRPDVPPEVDGIIQKLLAREPADRFQTPAELVADLEPVLHAVRMSGPPSGRLTPAGPISPPAPAPGSDRGRVAAAVRPVTHTPAATTATAAATVAAPGTVPAHTGGVSALAVCPTGAIVVTGGADGTLKAWHPGRLAEAHRIAGEVGLVEQVAVDPTGRWAASVAMRLNPADIGVQLWDLATGAEIRRYRGPVDNLLSVAISPDGRRLAAGSADGSAWVWPVEQSDLSVIRLRGHRGPVTAVLFLPGGAESLLTGGDDGMIRQWDLRTETGKRGLPVPVGRIRSLAFSRLADKRIAVAGSGGLVVRQRDGSFTPVGGAGPVRAVAFSPDGQRLASAHPDGAVRVWRAADGGAIGALTGHPAEATCVGWSADGTAVFAGGKDGTLRRWPGP